MIKTQKLVPEVYYNKSRDFQLLGRVYDIVFNYLKTNLDTIHNNPYSEDVDDKLISLVSSTLGFKELHEYNITHLKGFCSTFSYILRNKGNLTSIDYLLNLLMNIEGSSNLAYWNIDERNPYLLVVYIPSELEDTSLFEDVLTYILPAGMSYRIIKGTILQADALKDFVYFGNDYASVRVKRGSIYQASQIAQIRSYENGITNSSDAGFGRIEDMTILPQGDIEESVDDIQSDKNELVYPKAEE